MATGSTIETLHEECVSEILSHTSPPDACRFSMLSSTMRSVANSDMLWRSFLPSDYSDIISRTLNPLSLNSSSSFKDLFKALCNPLLLDGGTMIFKLDNFSGKKSYILSARELLITWSSDPMYWTWKPMRESRFQEVAELRTVSWLEIQGKIGTQILTPNTLYSVYLIMNVSHRGYGLDSAPSEVSLTVANDVVHTKKVYLWKKNEKNMCEKYTLFRGFRRDVAGETLIIQDQKNPGPLKLLWRWVIS
ncbi:F-box protein PP2-B15-like [Lotus japonicus]|uniref:F-box protein PP2-B15-like n=1 Tax=Lotus japonicus TaxID=34305 RepID=UPI00258F16B5|nr:F-box protein PP2-B15-like [Lotus japonicus]